MIFMYVCYFLFFKQKTAYEMRISDWSSDVCSSDLDRFLEIFGDRIAVDQHLSALLVDHDRGAARGVEVDKFVAPLPRRFAHQFVAHALFTEQKADFAREGTQGELLELARSEEHTSELQSLMSSVYAVVCLKKKKN